MTVPKQFVGLHAHSNFSTFDGLGYPDEHQAFAVENGLDAHALTDHGNMNGFPHAEQNARALAKKGIKFKFLPGVEAYYHPDLADWRASHAAAAEARKAAKKSEIVEEDVGVTVENEEETKDTSRPADPIRRRHHMVLLAKNRNGLQNIFQLISRSYNEGFYKFPRIDRAMLKQHGEDIVVTSACIGGALAYDVNEALRGCPTRSAHELDDPNRMEAALRAVGNTVDQITDAVGVENFFPEIQFNKLDMQHTVNRVLLEFSKRNGIPVIATADSHYCRPELWIEREIYKKLGRLKFEQIDPSLMPKDKSQLKCELYPKNAPQMWETYQDVKAGFDWYDDSVICGAIERTWDIAHSLIGDPSPDTSMKLPKFLVPAGMTPLAYLIELCKTGIREKGLHTKKEYVDRLRTELETIKTKDFALYFITMKSIIDIAKSKMLVGPGRGSAAGSLVCFILGITTIDPIKYGLLFERFISPSRKDSPDVDCIVSHHLVKTPVGYEKISDLVAGDTVIDINGTEKKVLACVTRNVEQKDVIHRIFIDISGTIGTIVCNGKHKLFKSDATFVRVDALAAGDELLSHGGTAKIVKIEHANCVTLTDITVEETASFQIVPFDVEVSDDGDMISIDDYIDTDENKS